MVHRLLVVRSYPQGPRCWVAGQRVHHGATGALLIATRRPALMLLGAALMLHDRHDWRVWFAREALPMLEAAGEMLDKELSTP